MFKQKIFFILIAISNILLAQNNTSSPYSLFGLGIENKIATGSLTALGNTGIANNNSFQINNANPASLGNIVQKSFLYEFGLHASSSTLKNSTTSETITNGNISHFAIAFPIKHNWGLSLGLLPQTKVGYNITTQSNIIGSAETFSTNVIGTGGVNNFFLASGFKLGKKLSIGINASVLFGTINQTSEIFSDSFFNIIEENRYNGLQLKTGFQYSLFDSKKRKTTIGGILELPFFLDGRQTRTSFSINSSGTPVFTEDDVEYDIEDFDLPVVTGIGITSNIYKDFTASLNFTKLYWDKTDQADDNDQYTNQDIYALGIEYAPSKKKLKYLNKLKYRFGFNYNNGFLTINNEKIDSYFVSLGAGIPLDRNAKNFMNLSYSYGKEGTVNNDLIQENFHKITLNLSFIGNWFKERKIF